jgi:hypothetical protein
VSDSNKGPVDPVEVLRNPGEYLLDGRPIDYAYVVVRTDPHCVACDQPDRWARVTRKPRKRTVRARAYKSIGDGNIYIASGESLT